MSMDAARDALDRAGRLGALLEVARHARTVMDYLRRHGPPIVPHLMDTDDNPGQRLREALDAAGHPERRPCPHCSEGTKHLCADACDHSVGGGRAEP